jgi:hypothetical protein
VRTTGADERSVALRTAMDAETFPLYQAEFEAMDAATRERVGAALATDASELVVVVIATENGHDLGHAALRPLAEGGLEGMVCFEKALVG